MDRVNEVTKEVFNALGQIRRADEHSQPLPEMLNQRMRAFVDRAMKRAQEAGFAQEDVADIAFALVALTDEIVMAKGGELRDFWLPRMLQLQVFNTNVAGEEFFTRLDALRQNPARMDTLRVFYLCLLFGFQGRYHVRGGEAERQRVVDDVAGILYRAGLMSDVQLSPFGARPQERIGGVRTQLPLIAISVAAVLLAVVLYVFFQFSVGVSANSLIEHIEERTGQPSGEAP